MNEYKKANTAPAKVEAFQTSDGKVFMSLTYANMHQLNIESYELANGILEKGGSIADCLREAYCVKEVAPILESVTKHSKLVIEHWQCKKTPGYSPIHFGLDGRVYVGGNAGSWSGSYSSWVNIGDLERYAEDSRSILCVGDEENEAP